MNKSRVNLLDYLENIGKQSAEQGSRNYARTVLNTVRALKLFRGDYIAFRDVDRSFFRSLPIPAADAESQQIRRIENRRQIE